MVAEEVGRTPTVTEYRAAERPLRGTDEALEESNRLIRDFGSWRRVREAPDLPETTSLTLAAHTHPRAGATRIGVTSALRKGSFILRS